MYASLIKNFTAQGHSDLRRGLLYYCCCCIHISLPNFIIAGSKPQLNLNFCMKRERKKVRGKVCLLVEVKGQYGFYSGSMVCSYWCVLTNTLMLLLCFLLTESCTFFSRKVSMLQFLTNLLPLEPWQR